MIPSHSFSDSQYRNFKMQVWEISILFCSTVLMLIGTGTFVLLLKYYNTIPFNFRNTVTYLTIFLITILTFGIVIMVSTDDIIGVGSNVFSRRKLICCENLTQQKTSKPYKENLRAARTERNSVLIMITDGQMD